MKDELMSEVRRRLKKSDVVGVIVSPSGRIVEATVDSPCPRIPAGGRLFSFPVGSTRIVDALA
jgi:hypothetical protein